MNVGKSNSMGNSSAGVSSIPADPRISSSNRSVFSPANRFRDTNPQGDIIIPGSQSPRRLSQFGTAQSGQIPHATRPSGLRSVPVYIWIIFSVALAAVIGLVLFLVINNRNTENNNIQANSDSSHAAALADYRTAFNKFANYIATGKISEKSFKIPGDGGNYMQSIFFSGSQDAIEGFLDQADILYQDFYISFSTTEDTDDLNNTQASFFWSIHDSYLLLSTAYKIQRPTAQELFEMILADGISETGRYISQLYDPLGGLGTMSGENLMQEMYNEDNTYVQHYIKYYENDCISDGSYDPLCVLNVDHDYPYIEEADQRKEQVQFTIINTLANILPNCEKFIMRS